MSRTGGCLCGQVTYALEGDPIAVVACHCSHCQRQSGSAFSVNVIVLEAQLAVTGTLQSYLETGEDDDGEYVRRRFCGTCGSPIVSEILQPGGVVAVKAGTLDDRTELAPAVEVWCVDRQPWAQLPGMLMSMDRETP